MKVAHLSSVHSPSDVRILHKECRTLAEAGHEVVFIVPGEGQSTEGPVRIRFLPVPSGRRERVLRTVPALYRAARDEGADVYHFHDPELIPVGLLLRLGGRSVIYDVHEDAPSDILTKDYLPRPVRWLAAGVVAGLEWLGGRAFSGIAAATATIARRFPTRKTIFLQNFPRMDEFDSAPGRTYRERENVVAYVGGLARIRGIEEMVDAMKLLPERHGARLELAGAFQPEAIREDLERRPGWNSVSFLGWLDRDGIAEELGRARVGIVTLHPISTYLDAQPVKLYEYMAAGLPVVASDFPKWREIVDGAACGLLVDPLDPPQISEAIAWLFDHPDEAEAMGRRGREAVLEKYDWRVEEQKLLALYDRIFAEG